MRPAFWPSGQLLTGHARIVAALLALTVLVTASESCHRAAGPAKSQARRDVKPTRGGAIVGSVRAGPASYSRFTARDTGTELVSELTQASLVRINRVTKEVEPWLAESWAVANDGREYTLKLRSGVEFSDGQPFTADDVAFSFMAAYDLKADTVLADVMKANGKPLQVTAAGPHTVIITFPEPFGPGLRLLDSLPIVPRHKLDAALRTGTFAKAWGLETPVSEVVGLGPFIIGQHVPGQRIVFDRNPHYWRKAADGTELPYLDRVTLEVVPDQNAELLRLDAGQDDFINGEVTPEAYALVKRAADEGRVVLHDLGVAYQADWFWFNLKPGAFGADKRAAWLQRDELRRAISLAVDRKLFADTVFFGAGEPVYGPETPANHKWYWAGYPKTPHDPAAAKAELASIGLEDRAHDGAGILTDAAGGPARFTLITQMGRPRLERGASVIREELRKIGLAVDVVTLEGRAVIQRIVSGQYEAALFSPQPTDTDPGGNQDLWFSSGSFHVWNPSQPRPATDWERRIDELMTRQVGSRDEPERKRLYDQIQQIFSEHQPILYFVAPRWFVAVSSRMVNVTPAIDLVPVLWSSDTLAVVH